MNNFIFLICFSFQMPILQQFDNTESQTNIGAFDWVEENTIAALRLDSIDSLQLQNYQQQAQALLDSMALLDSLQAWAGANNSQQRDNLSAQYDALLQQQRSYWQNIQAQRMQAIDMQLLPANQIIAANLDHETAEKLVNEIVSVKIPLIKSSGQKIQLQRDLSRWHKKE